MAIILFLVWLAYCAIAAFNTYGEDSLSAKIFISGLALLVLAIILS